MARAKTRTDGFTADEKAAMKERTAELKRAKAGADGEAELLAKLADLGDDDRAKARALHALVKATLPAIEARTWYGMPAYAAGGQVLCYLQPAGRFKTRYPTLGFSDKARLDDGAMWPTAFALHTWTPEVEARIAALLRRAAGEP